MRAPSLSRPVLCRPRLAALLLAALLASSLPAKADTVVPGAAHAFDYRLQPRRIADGVYVLIGRTEDFDTRNGGNIVNTGFLVGSSGVVVIDSGPSRRYGEQLRAAIAAVTPLPVVLTLNTHAHPDHFLGNQAFPAGTLAALPATRDAIAREGEDLSANLYRLAGDWMRGTEARPPGRSLAPGRLDAGGRELELIALDGHTGADLLVLDRASGTLFAGDLLFHDRAPTTPHADLDHWLAALERIATLDGVRQVVPGHGEVASGAGLQTPLRQTQAWLRWLQQRLDTSAAQGLETNEVLALPLAAEFATIAEAATEYRRSVLRLYPQTEHKALQQHGAR